MSSDAVTECCDGSTTPFGLYFAAPDDALAAEARRLESDVFLEAFGNTESMLRAEYGPYEDVSTFLVVIDHHRARIAGMMRLILDGHGSLKSVDDIGREPWSTPVAPLLIEAGLSHMDTADALDVATLAVDPEYRGAATSGLVSLALYQGLVRGGTVADMRWLVTILDVVVLDLIQTSTGAPFHFYPGVEPLRYLDSPSSVPVWCELADYQARLRDTDPGMAETLFDGVGLEAAVSPADYDRGTDLIHGLSSTRFVDLREPVTESEPSAPTSQGVAAVER